jgi:hypothetical protein
MKVGAHQMEHLNDDGIPNRIENLIANSPIDHDLLGSKDRKMLGNVRLLHPELFNQHTGGQLSFAQELQDGDPGRMSKCLKDVGLESAQWVLHMSACYFICKISNIDIIIYSNGIDRGVRAVMMGYLPIMLLNSRLPVFWEPGVASNPTRDLGK